VNRFPSTRMAEPFLNWLVDIMLESSPSRRPIFATILRGANPAQTPGYYRTESVPVSHTWGTETWSTASLETDEPPKRRPRVSGFRRVPDSRYL
jgi:hypothetical protein